MLEKLFPDPFLKNQNWEYLWMNSLKFYTVCFYCMPSRGLSQYIETKLQTTSFTLYKAFSKNKKETGTACFWRKIFILLFSSTWPDFIAWVPLLREVMGIMCIAIVSWPGYDIKNFEINLMIQIKPFLLHDRKVTTKI